jgi:hypothetical protein
MAIEKFRLKGFKEFKQLLEDLPKEVSDKLYQDVFKKSLQDVIVPAVRGAMPGHYSEKAKNAAMAGTFSDDPTGAWGGISRDAFWLLWADQGTKDRYVRGANFNGAYRGAIAGTGKIQQAIYNNTDDLLEDIIADMQEKLIKIMSDLGVKKT